MGEMCVLEMRVCVWVFTHRTCLDGMLPLHALGLLSGIMWVPMSISPARVQQTCLQRALTCVPLRDDAHTRKGRHSRFCALQDVPFAAVPPTSWCGGSGPLIH